MVVGLVVLICLLLAGAARANRYLVVQCQAGAAIDADWADTTGSKFYPDAYCDGSAGDHVKSFSRAAYDSVSGEQFARWRWLAPSATYLTKVNGDWWHALHDGMEQRIGSINWAGGFESKLAANGTDTTQRFFELDFPVPVAGLEDRLLCARGSGSWCSLENASWSGLKDLSIELEDERLPQAGMGGDLAAGGWRRGVNSLSISGSDAGSGVRYGETLIDGTRVALTEYPCAETSVGGSLVGTRMGPCYPLVSQTQSIDTTRFSDGTHSLVHCVYDFSGGRGCTAPQGLGIDNNPPAHPRPVTIADGGEGWHRVNRFALSWTNPDQGPASPIWGAYYRVTGANGYDTGTQLVPGRDVTGLPPLTVPGPGAWNLHLWLRDEAGNESAATGIDVPLRFDDRPPSVAFPNGDPAGGQVTANAADPLSGPAAGTISYRRAESQSWIDLPTRLHGESAGKATLGAPLPNLAAGTWIFRAEARDAAGNAAASSLRADGTQMSIKVTAAAGPGAGKGAGGKDERDGRGRDGRAGPARRRAKTRLFVRLRGGHGRGSTLTVPFGAAALLSGRLTSSAGAGLAGRRIKVVARPSRGALLSRTVKWLTTGRRGGFVLRLGTGTSRRISVSFPGNQGLAPARHRSLDLRVRSGVTLVAAPKTLRTGRSVHLSGRVRSRGAPIPRRGKLVAIQYLESDTGRWRPVLVTRTDHGGRFHARYRFRYIDGTARIRLRAAALAEERWPYAPGSSSPVTIEVRGG
jgi:hypothetical protein